MQYYAMYGLILIFFKRLQFLVFIVHWDRIVCHKV